LIRVCNGAKFKRSFLPPVGATVSVPRVFPAPDFSPLAAAGDPVPADDEAQPITVEHEPELLIAVELAD